MRNENKTKQPKIVTERVTKLGYRLTFGLSKDFFIKVFIRNVSF